MKKRLFAPSAGARGEGLQHKKGLQITAPVHARVDWDVDFMKMGGFCLCKGVKNYAFDAWGYVMRDKIPTLTCNLVEAGVPENQASHAFAGVLSSAMPLKRMPAPAPELLRRDAVRRKKQA